jgi:hypothetical protein
MASPCFPTGFAKKPSVQIHHPTTVRSSEMLTPQSCGEFNPQRLIGVPSHSNYYQCKDYDNRAYRKKYRDPVFHKIPLYLKDE